MPSTWLRWGTDGNGDGIADPWNAEDAITSAARYLAAAGGQTDIRAGGLLVQPRRLVRERGDVDREAVRVGRRGRDVPARPDAGVALDGAAGAGRRRSQLDGCAARRARPGPRLRAAARQGLQGASPVRPARAAAARGPGGRAPRRRDGRGRTAQARVDAARAGARPGAHRARRPPRSRRGRGRCSGARRTTAAGSSRRRRTFRGRPSPTTTTTIRRPTSPLPKGSPVYALAHGVVTGLVDDPSCGTGFRYADRGRPALGLLPPLLPGADGAGGHGLRRRRPRRPRRPHRRRDRPAPPPRPAACRRIPQDQAWFQSFAGIAFTLAGRRRPQGARSPPPRLPSGPARSSPSSPRSPLSSRLRRSASPCRGVNPAALFAEREIMGVRLLRVVFVTILAVLVFAGADVRRGNRPRPPRRPR